MSHPEIIDNCKKITVEYLIDVIGSDNIVSIILYGSVARNEESYKYVNGSYYLESDLDIIAVVRNRFSALKCLPRLRRLSESLSKELRKRWLLSYVNLSITTEDRLLDENPKAFNLHLKLNGRVIFGKDIIRSMPSYEYNKIPVENLTRIVFAYMITVVRNMASAGIFEGNITVDSFNSILKSIRKLTLFLLRVIIIKDSLPVNPYDMTDIKANVNLYKTKNSLCYDLLNSYDGIKLCDSKKDCSMADLEEYIVRVVTQFNSTVALLGGIRYRNITSPIKLSFGHVPLVRRVEYSLYIFLINMETRLTWGLFKFIISIIRDNESIYMRYYDLFISSLDLFKPINDVNAGTLEQRKSWLKLYHESLNLSKYDITTEQ